VRFLVIRGNVFILNALRGPASVGLYSVASQMGDVLGILPQSMALVLFPTLITAGSGRFR
jgi:O-antigen/teichoic acid export membrane protein